MVGNAVERHREKRKRKGERKKRKRIEEAVQYALSHDIRLEILVVLNEGSFTTSEVAELTGIELKKVSNHLQRMLEDGSIEVADKQDRRGTMVYWYRAVELPEFTKEEAEAMPKMQLQMIAGVVSQSQTAELMAALNKGTLASARTILSWDMYDVDEQGRRDIEEDTAEYLERVRERQCESLNRVAVSKEETTSLIVSVSAFKRARETLRSRVRSQSCDPPPQTD